jgi:predicted DNA-binding protein
VTRESDELLRQLAALRENSSSEQAYLVAAAVVAALRELEDRLVEEVRVLRDALAAP